MMPKKQITTIVWASVLIWALLLIINGVSVSQSWFSLVSIVIGILVILIGIFNKWLWKLSILHPWLISTPVLQGTWKGEIRSSYIGPKTGQVTPPIKAYFVVKQTYSTVTMRLMTNESSSESISNILRKKDDGSFTLTGIYCNTPLPLVRDVSPIHYGSVAFSIIDEKAPLLDGEYWTNRLTRGSIRFTQKVDRQIADYETADNEFIPPQFTVGNHSLPDTR